MAKDAVEAKREERGKKYRRKERKEAAIADARKHREWQEGRIKMLIKERDEARAAGNEDRVDLLNIKIDETKEAMARTVESIKRLEKVVPNAREAWRKARSQVKRLVRKRKKRRKKKRKKERQDDIEFSPGSPHWGGCADIHADEVEPAYGAQSHSEKRSETYGNPTSDHHVSQVWAFAGDFPPSVAGAIRIAKGLGIGYNGYADDYKLYYIYREGRQIRVQIIASNHGTGPHVHSGLRLT